MRFDDKLNKSKRGAEAEKSASVRDVFTAFTSKCPYSFLLSSINSSCLLGLACFFSAFRPNKLSKYGVKF